jgi:hypothetical protein
MKAEKTGVLTLWGDCGWRDPDDGTGYTSNEVLQGYRRLNEEINMLAQSITILSVSYAHIVMPLPFPMKIIRLFATVTYSSSLPVKYGDGSGVHRVDLQS